jgi:hypothetical protein
MTRHGGDAPNGDLKVFQGLTLKNMSGINDEQAGNIQ